MKTQTIDIIHDTCHLCTRFRIDGIKAMSHGFSGGKQNIKFAKARNRGRLCLFSQNETKRKDDLIVMQNVRFWVSTKSVNVINVCCMDIYRTVATASKKVKMITSIHNLPLSSLIQNVVHFLLSRINKLDRDFSYWKKLLLVYPLRNHVTSLLSHQSLSACKDGGHRE